MRNWHATPFALFILLFLIISGCSRDNEDKVISEGKLAIELTASNEIIHAADTRATEDETLPDAGNFRITIFKGNEVQSQWDKFSQYPDEVLFPVGNYTLEASYGQLDAEGFDLPYYTGSKEFSIENGETTQVDLTCSLANARMRILYTEAFKEYFTEYSVDIKSEGGNTVNFSKDESRLAYFKPGKVSVLANVKKQEATTTAQFSGGEITLEAKHEYTVTMDVDAGSATLNITFDDNVKTQEVAINISDEALNTAPPYFKATGFVSGTAIEVLEGSTTADIQAYLHAPSGIKECLLKTTSTALIAKGWPAETDLANADAATLQTMKDLGLQTYGLGATKDKMALIDFTNVIAQLPYDAQNVVNTFTLNATDIYSKSSEEDLVLAVKMLDNQFEIDDIPAIKLGAMEAIVPVTLIGDPLKDIKAYYTLFGVSHPTTFTVVSSTGNKHQLKISLLDAQGNSIVTDETRIKLKCGSKEKDAIIPLQDPVFTVKTNSEGDVWATKATLTLAGDDAATTNYLAQKDVEIQLQATGSSTWTTPAQVKSGNAVELTALTPGTTYNVRGVIKKADNSTWASTNDFNITTEAATQVPNAGMEDWYSTRPSGVEYWEVYYACKEGETPAWNTMNLLTTSKGGTSTNWFNRNGCKYCANSGTIETSDCATGSKAALIKTVGWGSNNNATADWTTRVCEYITPGELYLGTYNTSSQTPSYGYSFSSRPLQLSFYYKYTPKNPADYAYVAIVVKDASGQEIGKKEITLSGIVSTYTKQTLSIEYSHTTTKAVSMYIVFKSSANSACWTKSEDNLIPPPNLDLSDGEYLGSQLYIDDIELIY